MTGSVEGADGSGLSGGDPDGKDEEAIYTVEPKIGGLHGRWVNGLRRRRLVIESDFVPLLKEGGWSLAKLTGLNSCHTSLHI